MNGSTDVDVIPFQQEPVLPYPIQFFLSEIVFEGGKAARALTRVWRTGESSRCRLCPAGRCGADHELGVCQVHTELPVTHESAPLFAWGGVTDEAGGRDYRSGDC